MNTNACILWQGSKGADGYGIAIHNGKMYRAHRLFYELKNGPIPRGMYVCHKCDVPLCINSDHLFIGTPSDNARDAVNKGRNKNHSKQFCKRGHPLKDGNLKINSKGERQCKKCNVMRTQKWQRKRNALKQ